MVETDGPVRGQAGRLIETRFGANQLLAFDARAEGTGFTYGDGKTARFYVDGLGQPGNRLVWSVRGTEAAPVRVRLRYSTPDKTPPGRAVLRYGTTTLTAPLVATDGEKDLREVDLGLLPLAAGDLSDLSLTLEDAAKPVHVFDLRLER